MTYDANEILDRMRDDQESDWYDRLLHDIAEMPEVDPRMLGMWKAVVNDKLSRRQLDVLRCAAAGLDPHEMPEMLGIGYQSVQTHLRLAKYKLRAKTTAHAVALALREGLIP
jgi:DNA-binding CsgD family transcriptional regulator